MQIEFPEQSAFDFERLSVVFPALVDGQLRRVFVSCEALQDHFGGPTGPMADGQSFIDPFEANRGHIEAIAERLFRVGAPGDVVLTSASF